LACKRIERFGHGQRFLAIANDAWPAEIANVVHNLNGTISVVGQIAAVQNQVGRGLPQVRQNSLERG